jgi:hypothetical protein
MVLTILVIYFQGDNVALVVVDVVVVVVDDDDDDPHVAVILFERLLPFVCAMACAPTFPFHHNFLYYQDCGEQKQTKNKKEKSWNVWLKMLSKKYCVVVVVVVDVDDWMVWVL